MINQPTKNRPILLLFFIIVCLFFVTAGCSKPVEPPADLDSQSPSEQSSEVEKKEKKEREKSAGSTKSEQASQSESSSPNSPTTQNRNSNGSLKQQSSSGGNGKAVYKKPKSPVEAARKAEAELSRSENSTDLNEAYRHAANAYQLAKTFPGDKKGLAIADAALGRLHVLEKQGVKDLGSPSEVNGKTIIELP